MGKRQRLALGHVGGHLTVVDIRGQLVRHQHHDDVAGGGRLLYLHDAEVGVLGSKGGGLFPVAGALAQAHHHVHAAFGQVLGMGVALAAKADDGHGLAVQNTQVAVAVVILFDRHGFISPFST